MNRVGLFLIALSMVWVGNPEPRATARASDEPVVPTRLENAEAEPENWLLYSGTYRAWRYSSLDQINTSNVQSLRVAWIFQLGDVLGGLQATPIVVDGRLYVIGPSNRVFAIDAKTGRRIWSYFYQYPKGEHFGYGHFNRGVAVGFGKVYFGSLDNYVVALDSTTGKEIWKVEVEDSRKYGCNITGAPLVVKDMVIVGSTGGALAHRGHIVALDAETGALRWRSDTIPGPGAEGNETWTGDSWQYGGGAAWMTGSYDPQLNLLYWGVGNPAAALYGESRAGSNLFTDCIVALVPETGRVAWYFQEIPHDVWDYDSTYESILLDLPRAGGEEKLLVHPNKGGFVYILNRSNGDFVAAWPYVRSINWTNGLNADGHPKDRREPLAGAPRLICPNAIGARSWNHATFNPRTGLLYNIGIEWCSMALATPQEPSLGKDFFGGVIGPIVAPASGKIVTHLDAFEPLTGRVRWSSDSKYPLLGSLLSTGGDLVFAGDPEGIFFALDARTGARLWSFATGAGHRGSPVTYAVSGKQYVVTPSGWGSVAAEAVASAWPEAKQFSAGATLVAFTLP